MATVGDNSGQGNDLQQRGAGVGNRARQTNDIQARDWNDPMLERRRQWDDPSIVLNRSNIDMTDGNSDSIDFVLLQDEIHKDLFKPFYGFLGVFPGFFPGMYAIRNLLVAKWDVPCSVRIKQNGYVLFKFNSAEDRDRVMNGPDRYLHGKKLFMHLIAEDGQFDEKIQATKPIWIRMEHLPKAYWHKKALEKIATSLGEPILMDNGTLELRGFYARLLVWIDTSAALKETVSFRTPSGEVHTQKIIYDYCRPWCSNCGHNNHFPDTCNDFWRSNEERQQVQFQGKKNGARFQRDNNIRRTANKYHGWVKRKENQAKEAPSVGSTRRVEETVVEDASSDHEDLARLAKGKGKADLPLPKQGEISTRKRGPGITIGDISLGVTQSIVALPAPKTRSPVQAAAQKPATQQHQRPGKEPRVVLKPMTLSATIAARGAVRTTPSEGEIERRGRSPCRATTAKDPSPDRQQQPFGDDDFPLLGSGPIPYRMIHPEVRGSKPPRVNRSRSKSRPLPASGALPRSSSTSRTRTTEQGKGVQKPYQRLIAATRSTSGSLGTKNTEGGGPKPQGTSVSQ